MRISDWSSDVCSSDLLIGALPGELGYDTSDDLLDPRNGLRARLRLSPEASLQGGVTPYVRGTFDLSGYYGVSNDLVIAARTRLGSIIASGRADIAPSRRDRKRTRHLTSLMRNSYAVICLKNKNSNNQHTQSIQS